MMHENDRVIIPEEYLKMSALELIQKKEKLYEEIQKRPRNIKKKKEMKNIVFY